MDKGNKKIKITFHYRNKIAVKMRIGTANALWGVTWFVLVLGGGAEHLLSLILMIG